MLKIITENVETGFKCMFVKIVNMSDELVFSIETRRVAAVIRFQSKCCTCK